MNLKELIKKCESIAEDETNNGLTRGFHKAILDDLKNLDEVAKVEIPLFAEDVIKVGKAANLSLFWAMNGKGKTESFRDWIEKPENQEVFARAWNEGYVVKESKYVVTDGNHLYFKGYQEDVDIVILADEQPGTMYYVKKFDTKEEAQKVADVLGWKVQEVV